MHAKRVDNVVAAGARRAGDRSCAPSLGGAGARILALCLLLVGAAFGGAGALGKVVDVIEYHHAALDHYFVTALPDEIAALDAGTHKGWQRTGHRFRAHDSLVNGTAPVCRYYMPPAHGDSHFYSASVAECAQVRSKHPAFVAESNAVMYVGLPHHVTGECGAEEAPVFRVWNNRADANHRYVTDATLRAQLVAQGWVAEGYGKNRITMCTPKSDKEPAPVTAALPPPCKGPNPRVAVPGAPHGMYVWAPNAYMLSFLEKDVIGKDPTLCGASLVIDWSSVETAPGVYDWSAVTTAAAPFTSAELTVNLLFAEATEGTTNNVTPAWVTAPVASGGLGVPTVACEGGPAMPVYWNPAYEAAWSTFIAAAIKQFSYNNSALATSVGYLRFATGGGAEALPPPGYNDGGACQAAWANAGYTYDAWNLHVAIIINAMGTQATDKQVMVSLPQVAGGPTVYTVSNLGAAIAASFKLGFSFESLGVANVAAPGTSPGPCNTAANNANLHWCQAYTSYVGQVPLAAQSITATTKTTVATMDLGNLLQYAIANHIQILELYPEEWIQANSPTWPSFVPANQAKYQAALQAAAQTLGATNGQ